MLYPASPYFECVNQAELMISLDDEAMRFYPQVSWGYLVLMTGSLAIFCQCLQSLGDEGHVVFIDVEAQQAQPSCGTTTHNIQKLQGFTHQIVVGFIVLTAEEVL